MGLKTTKLVEPEGLATGNSKQVEAGGRAGVWACVHGPCLSWWRLWGWEPVFRAEVPWLPPRSSSTSLFPQTSDRDPAGNDALRTEEAACGK